MSDRSVNPSYSYCLQRCICPFVVAVLATFSDAIRLQSIQQTNRVLANWLTIHH
jgi:hypothetical protein